MEFINTRFEYNKFVVVSQNDSTELLYDFFKEQEDAETFADQVASEAGFDARVFKLIYTAWGEEPEKEDIPVHMNSACMPRAVTL